MPVPSPVMPLEDDPLQKIRKRVRTQAAGELTPLPVGEEPVTPLPPTVPQPTTPLPAPVNVSPKLPPPPMTQRSSVPSSTPRPNYYDSPETDPSPAPNFPPPGPDPNAPPTNPGGDPEQWLITQGVPKELIYALYTKRGKINDQQAALSYLQPFIGPWKARDWKGLFQVFTKDLNPNALLDPTSGARQVLEDLGYKISPPNAAGETTKIQTPDGHWIRVLEGAKGSYTYTWVDQGDGGGGAPDIGNYNQQIRDLILKRIGELKYDPDSPLIQQTMAVNTRDQELIRQQRRAADAERDAFNGLNSGGAGSGKLEQDINAGYEDKGNALSRIRVAVNKEQYDQLRQEMLQLLSLAKDAGDSEAARQLQAWWYGIQMAFEQNRQNQQPF